MNKIIRLILMIVAVALYVIIFGKITDKGQVIGLILIGGILLISMEATKRSKDQVFALQSEVKGIDVCLKRNLFAIWLNFLKDFIIM